MFGQMRQFGWSALGLAFGLATVTLLVLPSTATAGGKQDLTEYLPGNSQFAAHVDVDELRKSKYFDRAVKYLEDRTDGDDTIAGLLKGSNGFDAREDLDSIAIGLPVARVSPSRKVDRAVVSVSGDFDESQVEKFLKEEYSELSTDELDGGTTLYRADDRAFAVPVEDRLVVAVGPESYRESAWKLLDGKGSSFADVAASEDLLAGLDTSRTVWMLNRLSSMRSSRSNAESIAVAVDLKSGVDLQVLTRAESESDAKGMVKRAKAMKESGSSNAMLQMFGATPLLENLELDRHGVAVAARTSMTASELDYMVGQVQQLAQSRSQLSIPESQAGSGSGSSSSENESENGESKNE